MRFLVFVKPCVLKHVLANILINLEDLGFMMIYVPGCILFHFSNGFLRKLTKVLLPGVPVLCIDPEVICFGSSNRPLGELFQKSLQLVTLGFSYGFVYRSSTGARICSLF